MPSPLSVPLVWNLVAPAYAEEIAPFLAAYSREALALARVVSGSRVVDVAAGPGTLSFLAAAAGAHVSAIDFSHAMIDRLRARAEQEGVSTIGAVVGDGMALPYGDASFDAAFSMFGLFMFPDRGRGFRELARLVVPGGRAVVGSWQALDRVPAMETIFTVVGEVLPPPPGGPPPPALVDPASCLSEMTAGGFHDAAVHEARYAIEMPSTQALLGFMARTLAPLVLLRQKLGDGFRPVEERLLAALLERLGAGPQRVEMPAWLTVGAR